MIGTDFKIVALLFVALFLVAAVHELVPGMCLPSNPDGSVACPFCNLLYTLLILVLCFLLAGVSVSFRSFRVPPSEIPFASPLRTAWSRRGPPAVFV
jgi:hypothetical protein